MLDLTAKIRRAPLQALAILLVLAKSIQFAIDSTALSYFDSGAFIMQALGVAFSPERSYTYGFLIAIFALPFHSVRALVVMQVAMGGLSAWLLGFALIRLMKVRAWIAILAALAFAFDPVQVFYEHMIMTETTTLLVMAVFLIAAGRYLQAPSLWLLAGLSAIGILLVSLRIVYLPPVLVCAVFLPVAAYIWSPAWPQLRSSRALAVALAVSCGFTLLFHLGYTSLNGRLVGREPAYHYKTGFFLVAAVAPIIKVQDSNDARVARAIVEQNQSTLPLSKLDLRVEQLFDDKGFVARLKGVFGGDQRLSNQAAQRLARAAILRNPAGFLRLGAHVYLDFFRDLRIIVGILPWEDGSAVRDVFPWEVDWFRSAFGTDLADRYLLRTPSRRLHMRARAWYGFLLVSPFLAAFALWLRPRPAREASLVAALFLVWTCLLLTATCLGTIQTAYRYLHPLSFTGMAAVAFLAEKLSAALNLRSARVSFGPPGSTTSAPQSRT